MIPANSRPKHIEVEDRLNKLSEESNVSVLNRMELNDTTLGIITSGISYEYCKEVFGEKASYLKLGLTYPMPDKLIKDFARKVDRLIVVEENEPFIENYVKTIGISCQGKELIPICGELNPEIIREAILGDKPCITYSYKGQLPNRPPVLCAGCPHRGIFYEVSKHKDIIATGDIGCYTLGMMQPLNVTDTVICMGASISGGIGLSKARRFVDDNKKIFAFIGDSTFFHSGITGLISSIYNKEPIVTCILDNRTTGMTGHNENPGTGRTLMGEEAPVMTIEKIVLSLGVKEKNMRVIEAYNLGKLREAIKDAKASEEPFVIITKEPCALKKDVIRLREGLKCHVNIEKCRRCKACLRTGCPALSFKKNTVVIDGAQCNGCEICKQVCPFSAIEKVVYNE